MAYKILAFDIDGTLTNSQKIITEETKRAIFAAMDKGCKVLIASGRPVKGLRGYAEELHLKENGGYILSLNGGYIMSCADEKVLYDVKVPKKYYKEIYELSKKHGVNLLTYQGETVISEDIDDEYLDIEARLNGLPKKKVDNLYEYLDFEVNKFLMTGDGDYLAEVEKDVYDKLHNNLDVYRSEPFFLEILPKDVNKGKALEALLAILGVDRDELMAFGDGYKDLLYNIRNCRVERERFEPKFLDRDSYISIFYHIFIFFYALYSIDIIYYVSFPIILWKILLY